MPESLSKAACAYGRVTCARTVCMCHATAEDSRTVAEIDHFNRAVPAIESRSAERDVHSGYDA